MYKNRLKINFFQSQLKQLVLFQQNLTSAQLTLKQTFSIYNPYQQKNHLSRLNQKLQFQIKQLRKQIQKVKRQSNLTFDQGKIQGHFIFEGLENKVQDLNQRLYVAEKSVQIAEGIKKQMDLKQPNYQMSNVKQFKRQAQTNVINGYLSAEVKVINQFKRSIQLMMKINEKNISRYQTGQITQLQNILANKVKQITFTQFKTNDRFYGKLRKSKSLHKYCNTNQLQLSKKKFYKEHLISILLKSSSIPYQKQRVQAIKKLVIQLRQQNKKSALVNKYLTNGLQLRNREQVYKYFQQKINSELNQEQCVIKIQLLSEKLNSKIQERLLGIKNNMKCIDYLQGKLNKKKANIKKRKVKSLQKLKQQLGESKKIGAIHFNIEKKQYIQKQSSSNPKTNDSLTGVNVLC